MGEIIEIEASIDQFILMKVDFSFLRNKFRQNTAVFAQYIVHIAHIIGYFAVQPVIIIVPAHIRTKFLINSTSNGFSAIEAYFFHTCKFNNGVKNVIF